MLVEQQFIKWFKDNGIDISIPVPLPLMNNLCRKALITDTILFSCLSEVFEPYKKHMSILKFGNWNKLYSYYLSASAKVSGLKA